MGLPPGPAEHPIRQALAFGCDPYAFLARTGQRFGPVFTLRPPGDPPRIVISEPSLIRGLTVASRNASSCSSFAARRLRVADVEPDP